MLKISSPTLSKPWPQTKLHHRLNKGIMPNKTNKQKKYTRFDSRPKICRKLYTQSAIFVLVSIKVARIEMFKSERECRENPWRRSCTAAHPQPICAAGNNMATLTVSSSAGESDSRLYFIAHTAGQQDRLHAFHVICWHLITWRDSPTLLAFICALLNVETRPLLFRKVYSHSGR